MITIEMRRDPHEKNHLWAMHDEAHMELVLHAARDNLLDAVLAGTGTDAALTITVGLDEPEAPRQDGILSPGHGASGYPAAKRLELLQEELQEKGLLASSGQTSLRFEAQTDEEATLLERLTPLLRDSYSPPTAELEKPRYCVATVRVAVALEKKNPDCHYDDERWAHEAIEAELDGLELVADHEFVSYPHLSPLPARRGHHECHCDKSPF